MSLYDLDESLGLLPESDTSKAARNLSGSFGNNPDDYAERLKLQTVTGTPAVLMDDPAVREDAKRKAYMFNMGIKDSPGTASFASNPNMAALITDDVPALTSWEKRVKDLKGVWKDVIAPTPARAWSQFVGGTGGLELWLGETLGVTGLTERGKEMRQASKEAETQIALEHPLEKGSWSEAGASALSSMYLQAPFMGMGYLANTLKGGMATTLSLMGLTTAGQTYGERRGAGVGKVASSLSALWDGAVEVGTELLPTKTLFQMMKPAAKQTVGKLLLKGAEYYGEEMVGESLATFLQDANDKVMGKPDQTAQQRIDALSQYITSGEAYDNWIATLKSTFIQSTLMLGAGTGINRLHQRNMQQTALIDTLTAAEASRLHERSPEAFADFAQRVGDTHGISNVYMQADKVIEEAVKQGIAEEQIPEWLAQYGATAEDLTTAIQTGGKITMDFGKVAAGMKTDEVLKSLQSELLIDPTATPASQMEAGVHLDAEHLAHLNEIYLRDQEQKINHDDITAWQEAIMDTEGLRGRVTTDSLMPIIARANALSSLVGTPAIEHLNRMLEPTGLRTMKYSEFQKQTDGQTGAFYQEDIDQEGRFARQVDDFMADKMLPGHVLAVSSTPDVLKMLKAGSLPVVITQKNAEKILKDKHGLDPELVKQLPAQLADPIMIFESASQPDSYVVMTNLKKDGKTIVAAVHLDRRVDRVDVNEISSVHPRESDYHFINWIKQGLLRYQDKQKSREWLMTAGLQLPMVRGATQGSGKKILYKHDLVKWKTDKGLRQETALNKPLGSLTIEEGRNIVTLFERADKSTFLHETAHIFLNDLKYVSENLGIQKAEWEKVREWLGVGEGGVITREQHEKFAEHFEAYLRDGQAPSGELRNAFRKFKKWLTSIYDMVTSKRFGQRDITVAPEIADLFDRLLATEQEIKAMKEQAALVAMLNDKLLNETGFTKEQVEEYRSILAQSDDAAREKRDRHKLVGREARLKAWRKQATEEAAKHPVFAFVEAMKSIGVSRKSIVDQFGDHGIPATSPMFKGDGLDINVAIAEHGKQFGYESAGAFVSDLRATPPRKLWMQKRVGMFEAEYDNRQDTRDAIRTASLRRQIEIESQWLAEQVKKADADYAKRQKEYELRWRDADAAFKEAVAVGKKEEEIRVLKEKLQSIKQERDAAFKKFEPISRAIMRIWAERTVAGRTMSQIQNIGAMLSESRNHRQKAIALARQGKWAEALDANERARLTEELIAASYRAARRWQKMLPRWRNISKWTADNKNVKIGQDFRDQINRVLQQYGIAKKEFDPGVPDIHTFAEKFATAELDGGTVLPDWMGIETADYRKMKWEHLQELSDTLEFLYGHGREEINGLKTSSGARVADYAADIASRQAGLKDQLDLSANKAINAIQRTYRKCFAHMGILRFIAKRADGFTRRDIGPAEQLVQNILNGMGKVNDHWTEINKLIEPELKILFKDSKKIFGDIPLPESMKKRGTPWTKERVVVAMLNSGNDSNLQRLMAGYGLTDDVIHQMAAKLTVEEWQSIQRVWNAVNTLWPKISDVHEKLNYFRPKKIDPRAMQVIAADGTVDLAGGYYPVAYDRDKSRTARMHGEQEDIKASQEMILQKPAPKAGATKARAQTVTRPLELSLAPLGQHFTDMIKYIHLSEAVRDADRVFRNKELAASMDNFMGQDLVDMIRPSLINVLRPAPADLGWFEKSRVAMSIYYMGYNSWTALQNITGIFPVIYQAGFNNYLNGIGHIAKLGPLSARRAMLEASPYMRLREKNIERDLKKQLRDFSVNGIEINGKRYNYDDVKDLGFAGIRLIDSLVSLPAWWGMYNDQMAEHGNPRKAMEMADAAIDKSLGSGLSIASTGVGRHKFFSLLAPFMSFAATQQEVLASEREGWKQGKISTSEFLYGHLMTWVAPALMSTFLQGALMYGIMGALGGGDDKKKKDLLDYFTDLISYRLMGVPLVRDVYNAVLQGIEGRGPITSARMPATEAYKMIQQLAYRVGSWDTSEKTTKAMVWAAAEIVSLYSGIPATRIYERWMKGQKNIENGSGWWGNHFVPQEKKK